MTDFEFQKMLLEKKLFDSLQYYDSCRFQMDSAKISYNALSKIVEEFERLNDEQRNEMFRELAEKKRCSWINPGNEVDYFGQKISWSLAVDKLTAEIMSILHNFFDLYAQWLNSVLFGERAIEIGKVTLNKVINKLGEFPEYQGDFITNLHNIISKEEYKFIADYNNITKHRFHLKSELTYSFFDGKSKATFPMFEKEDNAYDKKNLLDAINSRIAFCENLLDSSRIYVENYYSSTENKYVQHRVYNPKTYIQYDSEQDYLNNKPHMHTYFIEVDPNNILPEYHVMLKCSKEDRIEAYNSVYPVIALKDKNVDYSFIGSLIPEDEEDFVFNDVHNLRYRKYKAVIDTMEITMLKEWSNPQFHVYPMLSDVEQLYLTEDKNEKVIEE